MATGKKTPPSSKTPHPSKDAPMAPRKSASRKAAKPPVINLKATEIKPTKSSTDEKAKSAPKPEKKTQASSQSKTTKPSAPSLDKKPTSKSGATKAASPTSQKKKGKSGLILVSMAALLAASIGGAWAFKQYGQKFFTSPNSANTAQIAILTKNLTAIEEKLTKLQSGLTQTAKQIAAANAAQSKTNEKLAGLETSITQINTALKQAAQKGAGPADAANTLALEKLTSNLSGLQTTVKTLKASSATNDANAAQSNKTLAQIQTQLKSLTQDLVASQANNKATAAQLAQSTKTLAALKMAQTKLENAPTSSKSGKMASAFTILRANISAGQPFATQLDEIAAQLPQELALDKLRPFAQKGAPTNQSLLASLKSLSLAPNKTTQVMPVDPSKNDQPSGIMNSLTSKLSGLVKVTKVGEVDWQKQQNKAIALLKTGDLKAALTQITSLQQKPPQALSNWLDLAHKKLDIDMAVSQISASVMARLTANNQPNSQ